MARRNQGRDIDADDRNRRLWLKTLGDACEKSGWRIHARLKSDASHPSAGAEGVAGIGATEKATGAGLCKPQQRGGGINVIIPRLLR